MNDERSNGNDLWKLLAIVGVGSIVGVLCIVMITAVVFVSFVVLGSAVFDDGHSDMRAAGGHTLGLSEGELDGDGLGGTSGRAPDAGD